MKYTGECGLDDDLTRFTKVNEKTIKALSESALSSDSAERSF